MNSLKSRWYPVLKHFALTSLQMHFQALQHASDGSSGSRPSSSSHNSSSGLGSAEELMQQPKRSSARGEFDVIMPSPGELATVERKRTTGSLVEVGLVYLSWPANLWMFGFRDDRMGIMVIDSYDMSKEYVNDLILPWCPHALLFPANKWMLLVASSKSIALLEL